MAKEKGLYQKYIVTKTSGKPLAPNFQAIVLRIDGGRYVDACRQGVKAFAAAVRPFNQTLAWDLDFKILELSQIDMAKREEEEKTERLMKKASKARKGSFLNP